MSSVGSHNPFKTIKSQQQMMVQDEEDMEGMEMAPSETSDDQHLVRNNSGNMMYPPKQIVPQLHQPSSGGSTAR